MARMAQTATLYSLTIDLSHVDRGVYETLDLKVARHPSESAEYMVARILAYCLDTRTASRSPTACRRATSRPCSCAISPAGSPPGSKWACRVPSGVHRASKLAGRVAIYTHRDIRQVLAQFDGQRVHRAAEIPVYELDRAVVEACAAALERRSALTLNVMDGQLYIEMGSQSLSMPIVAHALP